MVAYLVGTDEAGYGPNLGPLVVAATVWHVPDLRTHEDLYDKLQAVVTREVQRGDQRVVIADSKKLYGSGEGLAGLEQGVLSLARLIGIAPCLWRDLWRRFAPASASALLESVWCHDYNHPLPYDLAMSEIDARFALLRRGLDEAQVQLLSMRAAVVCPAEFNQHLTVAESKGAALSQITLQLVRDCLAELGEEPILVHCDKHGGRNHYQPLLQNFFPDSFVEIWTEGRAASVYRLGKKPRRCEFRFVAKGESFLPSALASMLAKYLRELAMHAFNAFWSSNVDDLKPTAGYPVDAKRFWKEIESARKQLGIADECLWRVK